MPTDRTHGTINHYLYFPTQEVARQAAQRLKDEGYGAEVRDATEIAPDNGWLTYVTAALPQSEDELDEAEEYIEAIASELGGEYDGYERDVRR